MKKQGSPIKVKDYFANPMNRIRQPAFVEIGYSDQALNTFVKSFTNRYNGRYISFSAIRQFIKSFTNNSPKLMQTYQMFFLNNFNVTADGNILLEHFLQFFKKEQGQSLTQLDSKTLRNMYKDLGELTVDNILKKCEETGVAMSASQAAKMIKMLNYNAKVVDNSVITEQAFVKAVGQAIIQQAK